VSNAIKYGAKRPVETTLSRKGALAILTVRDHGTGIPKEWQPMLFQRFERLAAIKHFAGLGLGLFIVRKILEASGGTIRVESDVGQGATFTVELPALEP
jgi:signal transduction histidine kinase